MVLLQDPDLELSAIDADIELRIYQEKTQLQTHCSDTLDQFHEFKWNGVTSK
jgi:hypothetical protein